MSASDGRPRGVSYTVVAGTPAFLAAFRGGSGGPEAPLEPAAGPREALPWPKTHRLVIRGLVGSGLHRIEPKAASRI